MKAYQAALCLSLLAGGAAANELAFFAGGDANGAWDDNVTRGALDRDRIEDAGVAFNVSAAANREFGIKWAATAEGFAEIERWDLVTGLDRTGLGLRGNLRWQPVLGYTQPWYQATVSVQDDDYGADERDSTVARGQLSITLRLTDEITGAAGVEYMHRDSEGLVYDADQTRGFVNLDYAFAPHWATYANWSYIHGDTFSSAQMVFCNGALAGTDLYPLLASAHAIEADTALNEATCGQWLAYRLVADTHALTLGLNRAFGHSAAFDLSLMGVTASAAEGVEVVDYERLVLRAGVLARF